MKFRKIKWNDSFNVQGGSVLQNFFFSQMYLHYNFSIQWQIRCKFNIPS